MARTDVDAAGGWQAQPAAKLEPAPERAPRTGVPSRLVVGAGAVLLCIACVLALFTAIECHEANSSLVPNFPWGPSLLYGASLWFWWCAVGYMLWRIGARRSSILRITPANLALHVALGLVFTCLHLLTMQLVVWVTPLFWPIAQRGSGASLAFFVPARISLDFLIYAFLWTTSAVARLHLKAQHDVVSAMALERQLSEAKLRTLQTQIEPHFLFNTLNAIATLVELGRQTQASEMLAHLNVILRMTLARSSPLKVPVSQELEVIENYLAIEQIRFADRLRVELRVDPVALDGMVPCFLLQPLVENAIRHGISQLEEDGLIQTSVSRDGETLHLSVRDNGPGRRAGTTGHGIGLKNTSERLSHFYPHRHTMRLLEPAAGGFEVQIAIPFEKAKR